MHLQPSTQCAKLEIRTMKLSIDQQTDYSHVELHRITKGIDLPSFVKEASADMEDLATLDKKAFAAQLHRAFPINSADRVYLSHAFFTDKKAELARLWTKEYVHEVENNIKQAADIFGVTEDINEYNRQKQVKEAELKPTIVLDAMVGGETIHFYSVKTAGEFKAAANHFADNLKNYPFSVRREMSNRFVQKSASFGVDVLPDLICKYAGMFYPDFSQIPNHIWYRSTKIANEQLREEYQTTFIKQAGEIRTKEGAFQLAEAMYDVEQSLGVYQNKAAAVLPDIVDKIFDLDVQKTAELLDFVQLADGINNVKELRKISADVYKEAFGIDIDPSDSQQLRDILPTMPLSDVSFFRERSGLQPE